MSTELEKILKNFSKFNSSKTQVKKIQSKCLVVNTRKFFNGKWIPKIVEQEKKFKVQIQKLTDENQKISSG